MLIKHIRIPDNFIRVEASAREIYAYIENEDENKYDLFETSDGQMILVTNTGVVIKEK